MPRHQKFQPEGCVQFGDASIKSEHMLRLKSEFDHVKESRFKIQTRCAILLIAESTDDKTRFGIICGHKFSKKAVYRNRARRLIKEAVRRIKSRIQCKHILFIPKKGISSMKMQEVQKEIVEALKKNSLWVEQISEKTNDGCLIVPFIWLIKAYQFLTPWLNCCRFYPSCSEYAIQALKRHGLIKGIILTAYRILRCNPYCQSGYDPVPAKFSFKLIKGKKK